MCAVWPGVATYLRPGFRGRRCHRGQRTAEAGGERLLRASPAVGVGVQLQWKWKEPSGAGARPAGRRGAAWPLGCGKRGAGPRSSIQEPPGNREAGSRFGRNCQLPRRRAGGRGGRGGGRGRGPGDFGFGGGGKRQKDKDKDLGRSAQCAPKGVPDPRGRWLGFGSWELRAQPLLYNPPLPIVHLPSGLEPRP
jgi:hypothetical protein